MSEVVFSCEKISAGYGRIKVVHDVSLDVRSGEILAVLGPNGAGKSTLLGALAGTVRNQGSIKLGDTDLSSLPAPQRARAGLAFVPEGRGNIFPPLSVAENLSIGLQLSPPNSRETRLRHIHSMFPILAERAETNAGMLSGGEQQMLAIGVALGREPSLLILDEPTQGLAPAVFDVLAKAFQRLIDAGISILVAEQNLSFAERIADRYFVLSYGEIVAGGSHEEMSDHDQIMDRYIGKAVL